MTWPDAIKQVQTMTSPDGDQPAPGLIRTAVNLALSLELRGTPPPFRVAISPNADIGFEWQARDTYTLAEVNTEGEAEWIRDNRGEFSHWSEVVKG